MIEDLAVIPTYKKIFIFNEIYRRLHPKEAIEDFKEIGENLVFVYNIIRKLQKEYKFFKPEFYMTMNNCESVNDLTGKYLEYFINKFSNYEDSKEEQSNNNDLDKELQTYMFSFSNNIQLQNQGYNAILQHLLSIFESNFYELSPKEQERGVFVSSEIFRKIFSITNIKESVKIAYQNHANKQDDTLYSLLEYVSDVIYITNFYQPADIKGGPIHLAPDKDRRNMIIDNIKHTRLYSIGKDYIDNELSRAFSITKQQIRKYFIRDMGASFKLQDIFLLEYLGINRDVIFGKVPKVASFDVLLRIQRKIERIDRGKIGTNKANDARKILLAFDKFLKEFEKEQNYEDYTDEFIKQVVNLIKVKPEITKN
ncbi:hypothetical protein [Bacillus sp. ISL-46]|uniref:hypothetical protein n=1 Tax=Bacillus sp. ISL-46 TaxID=2819129 RepID=UPI001BE835FF|nr:hypothetical protein [Bacillus sp. ISL-46]MBT2721427.1 hypothetical protein [Bacillus sp. ISL-46]